MIVDYSSSSPRQQIGVDLGLLLARVPIGVYFFMAGLSKLTVAGLKHFVDQNVSKAPLPESLGRAYLYCLPFAEIAVGVLLVIGLFTTLAGLLAALMLLSIIIAATGIRSPQGGPFHANVIYLGLTLGLMLAGPGRLSADYLLRARRRNGRR